MEFPRRDLLRWTGMASLAGALSPRILFASPPEGLFARGKAAEYTGEDLRFIGMPVGGICAGMVYLGGDGKLWLWDIFNANKTSVTQKVVEYRGAKLRDQDGAAYVEPVEQFSPFEQGFALAVDGVKFRFDKTGWEDIRFSGGYPVGKVSYADRKTKVAAHLTAFSPFIPLNEDDSGLPIVLMAYRIENHEAREVEIEVSGFLENPIGIHGGLAEGLKPRNEAKSRKGLGSVIFRADLPTQSEQRPELPVESWAAANYQGWTVEGDAFGAGPVERARVPSYQGDLGGTGNRVVNSHSSAPGTDIGAKDGAKGKLIGPSFVIERRYLNFWIGGGNHAGKTCLNLVVDGKVVRSATGHDSNRMRPEHFDVSDLASKAAHIEIVDDQGGPWGNIGIGEITQADRPLQSIPLSERPDFGTMALALFDSGLAEANPASQRGSVRVKRRLGPGESMTATFAVAWHFPNLRLGLADDKSGRYYAKRFKDAEEVINFVHTHRERLTRDTLLWHETWNDSTLPHWFLDRTFTNAAALATTTCHRFGTGRFYAWEGVACCQGTCTHVWHYAQAMGRLFPALERITRERVDYGIGFDSGTGGIGMRAEFVMTPAVDGQAGTILRTYREHQTSADDAFLRRVWPKVKQSLRWLTLRDRGDGLLKGAQDNTLDAAWYGEISWISSLYVAAMRAGEEMACEMGDDAFADSCHAHWVKGKASLETKLFNGEYFIQTHDPQHPEALGTYDTCHIDQVHGQSWAWQVGLGRVLDKEKSRSALKALFKYNFVPDVGPFRDKFKEGRWYAVPGEAGLVMVTNPRNLPNPYGDVGAWQYGYFNECMTGFEHQAASHMIAEGLVEEGFRVTKAVHDRYAAHKRNPFNEIECGDHYARSMASYGSFISACGFEYHGPKGHIAFDPRVTPDSFRAAFTASEGWGTYEQRRSGDRQTFSVCVRWGRLRLNEMTVRLRSPGTKEVRVHIGDRLIAARVEGDGDRTRVVFDQPVVLDSSSGGQIRLALG